jgi:hypothetical protein
MNTLNRSRTALAALLLASLPTLAGIPASAAPSHTPNNFADPAFKAVWTRTDQLVDNGSVKRSYYWGPIPGFTAYEEYAEGAHGKHLVQYFDKSRMEINNPDGDKNNPFYVTNGLLTQELISGAMRTGDVKFEQRYPAEINLASDTDDIAPGTPTYASFQLIANVPSIDRHGVTIADTINRVGQQGTDPTFTSYNVRYTYYEPATKHNIPDVFWTFLNATGPTIKDGKTTNARLSDPYFYATGYPIAEAYWARVKIAGIAGTTVLVQPYERRVLTYVPDAPAGFKVQMGNIGQHYYAWRYSEAGKPTQPPPAPTSPPRPTPTPFPCAQLPVRGFGKVWGDHPSLRDQLGCSVGNERIYTVVQQYFERGQMLQVVGNYGGVTAGYERIYVLFNDGSILRLLNTYVPGTPEPNYQPPSGLYAPLRGLGKVWREETASKVRERLGWATAPESVAMSEQFPIQGLPAPTPGQGGAVLGFDRGVMVYAGPVLKKIYVFYSKEGFDFSRVNVWSVYDDTYSEP